MHRVPLSALQTSESVAYHVPANPPAVSGGGGTGGSSPSHHSLYQPQTTVSPNRRFPAIAMLFPTTLTPFSSPNSSPPMVHHHLRSDSSPGTSKYHSAEQYEPRRPSVSQYSGDLSRPLRREPQHIYGSLSKAQSPYSYAPGSPLESVDKRPQEVSYDAPPAIADTPPRFLYERPLVDHERPHSRPMTSVVEPPQYAEHGRERQQPQHPQQPHQQSIYGAPKFPSSSQLRSSGQYTPVVTEKPPPPPAYVRAVKYASASPSSSSSGSASGGGASAADEVYGVPPSAPYHHRAGSGGSRQEVSQHQPESRVPEQEEQQPQQPPPRKLHPQVETGPMYRYGRNSQENTRMEDSPSAEKQTPSFQTYPVGIYGSGGSDGGRNTRRRYNLVYIPVDVLKKLLTEAGYRKKK